VKKFYAFHRFKETNGEEGPTILKKHFEKYGIDDKKIMKMDEDFELKSRKRQFRYVDKKIKDYGNPDYPTNTLLILDDFKGSDLLER
jgi:hypothetical protein